MHSYVFSHVEYDKSARAVSSTNEAQLTPAEQKTLNEQKLKLEQDKQAQKQKLHDYIHSIVSRFVICNL